MNINTQEVQKFSDISEHWWDPKGAFRPLHQLNPLRTNWITEKAGGLFNKTLLDVGCGGGLLAESLTRRQAIVTGIDASAKSIEVAAAHAKQAQLTIDYQTCTAEALARQQAMHFDVITCMEMLEHVPDPAAVVHACVSLAKPGASLFFSTINRTFKARLLAIGAAEYLLQLVPKGTHRFEQFIRPSELANWCRQANLLVQEITGVTYNPLLETFRHSKDVDVNYMLFCRKPNHDALSSHSL